MRRGSLSERYVKCSKPGCKCAEKPEARHGPYYSLTRASHGKTRSRLLSIEQSISASEQIDAGREFRQQVEAFWEACEQWANEQLEERDIAAAKAAEKRGSKRASKKKSSRNAYSSHRERRIQSKLNSESGEAERSSKR